MRSKWDRKLIDDTALTRKPGAQARNTLSTSSSPLITSRKQRVAATMNAITWFLVSAEMHEPTAKKAPAIKKLPTYPARITPLSGLPNTLTVIHIGSVSSKATPIKPQAARNFPKIASQGEIGSVIKSSMVPDLRSSAHRRMATAG